MTGAEIIGGILLILSLLGNWFQADRVNDLQKEADKWQEHAQQNYQEAKEAKEANDTNARTITVLENANDACASVLDETLAKIHRYKEAGRIDRATIDILRGQLAESNSRGNSDECRVPDWVEIQTEPAAIGGD